MNAGRDVERLITDWFVEEAVLRAPDRVLQTAGRTIDRTKQRRFGAAWRAILMPAPRLVAAAAVIGVLLVGGAFLILKPNDSNVGRPSPTPSTSSAVGPLDQAYHSRRYGYSISIPADWTASPATRSWIPGTVTNWGDPALDELRGTNARLVVASQPLGSGQSADAWLIAYCGDGSPITPDCHKFAATWPKIQIGNQSGYVSIDGLRARDGTIKTGGPIFDAVAVVNGRGYEFTLDGAVTRADFERLLATTVFTTAFAPRTDNLTASFSSPLYGYSVNVDPGWTTRAATVLIDDPTSTDGTANDDIAVTDTDSHISGAAGSMPPGWTFQQWLDDHHKDVLAAGPAGCDGGDPATWQAVKVGDQDGLIDQLCNAAEVDVHVGDKVFMFGWFNDTFKADRHLDESEFVRVLGTVHFPEALTNPPASPDPLGALNTTYTSRRSGFTIDYPSAWTVTPATADWPHGASATWGDPALDVLQGPTKRLVAASQPWPGAPIAWYQSNCTHDQHVVSCKDTQLGPPIAIGKESGRLYRDGAAAPDGTIRPGGPIYTALVEVFGRAYAFTFDGDVTRDDVRQLLATVTFFTPR